ncbi:MAG: dihydroneopterin aldolase [Dehalococcoidia bacterium]|nr:dihydroneopterin aldolase [Dehalococcoidia bacterium]
MAEDSIHLHDMVFYGYHGVASGEREGGQRFIVDLKVYADLTEACLSDRLEDTVDYGDAYRLVKGVIEGPSKNLLEALADEIARQVLAMSRVRGVKVTVKKPGAAIKGSILEYSAVEIERRNA